MFPGTARVNARMFTSILAGSVLAQLALAPRVFATDCSQQGGGSPARIVVVDGLDFVCSLWGFSCSNPTYYLEDALESLDLLVPPSDIHTFSWSRDSAASNSAILDLRAFLLSHYRAATNNGQKFIVVSHSWGTFLSYYALAYQADAIPVHCDLFITLGSPLGSRQVTPYDTAVWAYVTELRLLFPGGGPTGTPPVDRWVNYWGLGDVVSGPIDDLPPQITHNVNRNPGWSFLDILLFRNPGSTARWHWHNSLQPGAWFFDPGQPSNTDLRQMVAAEINQVALSNSSDTCEPNNSPATPCNIGGIVDRFTVGCQSIGPGDVDWFRFYTIQRSTDANYVRIEFDGNAGDLDMCVCPGGNCANQVCSDGTGDSETISLNGYWGGEFLVKVYGWNGATNPEYTLTIEPPSDACQTGNSLSIDNITWDPALDDGDTIVECGETANVHIRLCSSSTVEGSKGQLIGGGDGIDITDPEAFYGTISSNSCKEGDSYNMNIAECADEIRGAFALILEYRNDGFLYCQVIQNIFHDFPCCVDPGAFSICGRSDDVDDDDDCHGDNIMQSGDELEVRFAIRNTDDYDVTHVKAAVDPSSVPPGVVVDNGNVDYDAFGDISAGACRWANSGNSHVNIHAEKWYAGSFCADVLVIHDGRDPLNPFIIDDALCVTVERQAWIDVQPNALDFGAICADPGELAVAVVETVVYNHGTAQLEISGIDIVRPDGLNVQVTPPLPWPPIPPLGAKTISVRIESQDYRQQIDPPIDVRLLTDACSRPGWSEDRLAITGLFCEGSEYVCVLGVTGADRADISEEWIVWKESRHGNWDIFAYNTCTGEELQITFDDKNQGRPRISGSLIAWVDLRNWDGNTEFYNYDIYAFDLNAPELGVFPVSANATWRELLVGVDGNLVAFTRDYEFLHDDNGDINYASNLLVYEYQGSGQFTTRYQTGFTPGVGHQDRQSVDDDGDFGDGLLVFEPNKWTWSAEFGYWRLLNSDKHADVIDFAAGDTAPRTALNSHAFRYSAAAHHFAFVDWDDDGHDQIFIWHADGTIEQVTDSEFSPGDDGLAIGGPDGQDFLVYDYNEAERPGQFYMNRANNDQEGALCLECNAEDDLRMDGHRVVWVDFAANQRLCYSFFDGPDCTSDIGCDDGNACTTDVCENGCCSHLPDCSLDAGCDDGLFCNGAETCSIESCCQPGTDVDCDDGVNCTSDSCNENTDSCDNIPNDALCDDGKFCTGVETCHQLNDCQAGTTPACDDGIACTDDSCNPNTDECEHAANDANCDDGVFCNGAETCDPANGNQQTGCRASTDPCHDGIPCTSDDCEEDTDECPHDLAPDTCLIAGSCYVDGAINPFNQCEACDSTTGPSNWTPRLSDTACGDPSNTICDNPDTCDGAGTCLRNNEPSTVECRPDEGDCDVPEFCDGVGSCPVDASEQPGTACGDPSDSVCDDPDTCDGQGACMDNHEASGVACGDSTDNECTNPDTCDGEGMCGDNHEPDGTLCEDPPLFCNGIETCQNGTCVDGLDPCPDLALCDEVNDVCICIDDENCDDQVGCTIDICVDETCVYTPDDSLCDNGLFCDGIETCDPIADCQSGADPCDDERDCTADTCDEALNECHNDVEAGNCLIDAVCYADGAAKPGNSCQSCQPLIDNSMWSPVTDGTGCNDNNDCTAGDACANGACTGTAIPDCPPCVPNCGGRDCGGDGCGGSCGTCLNGQTCDPNTGSCVSCTSDGECDDDDVCNGIETCQDGTCLDGASLECDDENACTDDSCDPTSGCAFTPDETNSCNDSSFCNGFETCVSGQCEDGIPPCTADEGCCEDSESCDAECCDDDDCSDCDECTNGVCTSECDDDQDCDDSFCVRPCDGNEDCVGRMVCLSQVCTRLVFTGGDGEPTPPQPAPPLCNADRDCADPTHACVDGACLAPCAADVDCGDDESCEDGFCWERCTSQIPCPVGQFCDDGGACREGCTDGSSCDDGEYCNGVEECVDGICQPGNTPCPADQQCDVDANCCQVQTPSICGNGAWVCVMIGSFSWLGLRLTSSGRRRRRGD